MTCKQTMQRMDVERRWKEDKINDMEVDDVNRWMKVRYAKMRRMR